MNVTIKGGALRLCRSARCLFDEAHSPSVPLPLCTRPLIVSAHKEQSSTRMNESTQIVNAQISDLTERKENATHPSRGSRSIIGTMNKEIWFLFLVLVEILLILFFPLVFSVHSNDQSILFYSFLCKQVADGRKLTKICHANLCQYGAKTHKTSPLGDTKAHSANYCRQRDFARIAFILSLSFCELKIWLSLRNSIFSDQFNHLGGWNNACVRGAPLRDEGEAGRLSPPSNSSKEGSKRTKLRSENVRRTETISATRTQDIEDEEMQSDEMIASNRETRDASETWQTLTRKRSNPFQKTNTHAPATPIQVVFTRTSRSKVPTNEQSPREQSSTLRIHRRRSSNRLQAPRRSRMKESDRNPHFLL